MKQLLEQSGYVCETQADVWMRPGFASIAYSDGDEVEQRLAKIIGEASDISVLSDELKSHISDWPSLYHLSGTRANLLRPFEQRLTGAQVLEIGAGCGAITRYLAESGAHVLALEGSARRAAIARSRTRDLGNVAVLAERFDDFAGDAQFDVVTLIGVLEYANQFVAGDVPALTMLKRARALLKPDGVLLIAIENQLGLKYWAGAPEDHLGVPMYGIEERYRNDQPQTYGRAKLASLLAEAGFPRSDFYSPLPDYKLPVSVLTPSGLSSSDFDAAAFASQSARRDPQLPAAPSFALELAWPAIMRNRLGADLANSFLIAASNDEVLEMDGAVLAYHYSTERKRRFCKQTVFRRGEHGAIGVHCELLAPPSAQAQGPLLAFRLPAPIPYTLGHTLASDLVKMVSADGWTVDALGAELRRFLDIIGPIVFDGQRMPELGSAQQRLPGICFDLVPQNIVRDAEGRYHAIDLEWTLEHGMPVGWLLFRTLLLLVQGVTWFGRPGQPFVTTRRGFFLGAFRAAGFEIDAQELESFAALETAAQVEVTGRQVLAVANWWGDSPLPMRSATTLTGDALRALEVRVQQADASLEMTQSKLDEQTARAEQAERAALLLSERKEQEIQALEVRLREADEAAERMGRQVELLDRGMSEQTDRAVQVEHALLQSERRAAELQEQSEQSGRRAAELQEQSQHSAEARDALQRDLEQFHQASRDQMAHRDWHIAALQGSLQDMRNSTSWRITGPMRAISRTVTKMHTGTQLVPDAIRLGGGVVPTLRRTARVLRREGVDGVRLRLANIQAKAKGAVPVGLLEGPERAPAVQQLVPWYPNPLWDAEPAMVPEWVTRFAVHCHLDTPADATACLAWLQAIAIPFDLFISIAGGQGGSALQRRFKRGLVHAGAVQVTDAATAARPLTALLTHFGPAMASYPAVMHVHFSDADGVRAARSLLGPEGASGGRLTQLLGMLQQAAALVLAADTKPAMREQARAANAEWVTRVAQACKLRLDAEPAAWPLLGGSAFLARGACLQDALAAVSLLQDDGGGAVREAFVCDALAAMLPVFAAAQNAKALRIQEGDSIDDLREYEAPRDYAADIVHRDVKVLSYYLPQFHPTPENDEWHGKGFTEWTKVRGANPLFAGHYQQHIPHPDIGYYLLGSPAVLRLQAEQMRQAGVHGQVFYHYWFGGRMILEKPAQMLLAHPDIAMPYCFCWANENWTRRWDGNEREILLGQSYSAEDARAFIQYLIPFFQDSRYIRVGERPMLMVYRPSSIPDAAQYVEVWADECAKAGIAAPYVVAVLTRGATNPADFRMDAGVERVLHDWTDGAVPDLRPSLKPYWPMNGSALSYDLVRDFYMGQNDRKPFDYFRSNVPMWDNTARYGTEALLLHGSTPQSFQRWMEHSIADAQSNLPSDRRFVVVNAWNEWAEGTHLEPDTRYGYSYLNCIGRALSGLAYAHELNAGAAVPAGVKVRVHFTPELMQQLNADAQLRKRFFRCIDRSRILREHGVCASALPSGVELTLRHDPQAAGPSDLHLEFQRPVYFSEDAVENMLRTAWASRAVVVGNDYGAQLLAQSVLENGAVDSGVARQASVVVRPQHIGEAFDAPVRMRTDAWCFALPASPAAGADLPVVTTIVRFHRNARLDELRSAISCLYVMQDCIVVPLIAAQDLDAAQTAALHQMLAEFDWAPGFEPRVEHHASADGRGDLRSRMLNKSLQQVTTRYAAFLDYDDLLLPDAYAWLVHRLRTTGKAIAFGRVYWTGALSRMSILTTRRKAFEYGASHSEFVSNNHAPLHSILLDVQQLDVKNLVYFEDQRYMEDYLMTLQLFRADNGDWEGLSLNHYVGDYVHSMDRQHTLALNDDAVRAALLSDPEYMLCEKRIVDMRHRVATA